MYGYSSVSYADYLKHHGIKGQKWGVRRFQNSDGSYTAAGKARRGSSSGKKGMSDAKKAAIAYTAGIALSVGLVAALDKYERGKEFDSLSQVFNGPAMKQQINATNSIANNYVNAAKAIRNDPFSITNYERSMLSRRINDNLRTADSTLRTCERNYNIMASKKSVLKNRKRQEQLRQAKENLDRLTEVTNNLKTSANDLRDAMDYATREQSRNQNGRQDSDGQNNQRSNRQSNYTDTRSSRNTSRTKSTDRAESMKAKGVKVGSVSEESKNVRYWAKKVADAQKNGTLTADMVENLQNAKARKKIAVEQEQLKHGFICFCRINRNKQNTYYGRR